MWQSEGGMQVQVAHIKKIPPTKENSYMGCQLFFGGTPGGGRSMKKNPREFFSTPAPRGIGTHVAQINGTAVKRKPFANTKRGEGNWN